jgi:tetratricopeptide (TPR) repeat protein
MKRHILLASLIILAVAWTGCATKVRAKRVAPARYSIAGMRTVAVAEFKMECCTFPMWAERLTDEIEDKLEEKGFFKLVEGAPQFSADDPTDRWVRWGRDNDADAVLAGTITKAGVHTTWGRKRVEREVRTGRYKDGQEIIRKEVEYIPTISRFASMTVKVSFNDVITATRLDYEEYREAKSEYRVGDGGRRLPTDNEMLGRLTRKIAKRIVDDMVPRPVEEKIALAGCDACKDGIKLAKEGDWSGAMGSWQAVVASDPANHAALYNLGVASEVQGNYGAAADYYLQAMELDGKKMYRKAWQRANERIEEKSRLKEQMEGREE